MADDDTPFNEENVVLSDSFLTQLLNNHGVHTQTYNDINLYRKALLHKSYCTKKNENFKSGNIECPQGCLPLQEESNERLEFLGDAILNLVVADYLYERYPDANEGFLTKIRTRLVNGTMLAHLAEKIQLGKHIIISKQIESNNGRHNKKILEDAFEAILGAMYIDFNSFKINTSSQTKSTIDNCGIGFQITSAFIVHVLETYVDFSDLVRQKENPKDKLMKQCQHTFQWTPKLLEMDITEVDNMRVHNICVRNKNNDIIAVGKGSNRKQAEINASIKALEYFGWS